MSDSHERTPTRARATRPVRTFPASASAAGDSPLGHASDEDVHATLRDEFAGLAAETLQLRALLADATLRLVGSFHALRKGSAELAHRLESSPRASEFPELAALARATADQADPIVQGLQFEDMASQILDHLDRRLGCLEAFTHVVAEAGEAIATPGAGGAARDTAGRLALRRAAIEEVRRGGPQQRGLEGGDVELF